VREGGSRDTRVAKHMEGAKHILRLWSRKIWKAGEGWNFDLLAPHPVLVHRYTTLFPAIGTELERLERFDNRVYCGTRTGKGFPSSILNNSCKTAYHR